MSVRVIDAVFRRSSARGAARLVLLAMADAAHDSGELIHYARSYSHLAAKANVDAGTVRRAIGQLVEAGELEVLSRGDGRESSDYRILLVDDRDEGRQDAPPPPAPRLPRVGTTPTQGRQDVPPIIPSLPVDTPSGSPTPSREAEAIDAGFDEFWSTYPRKTAKGQARRVWRAAVRKAGSMLAVIAGAERYRDDPNREDRFTAHASTWLTGERWSDPPLPARGGQPVRRRIIENRDQPEGRIQL